MRLFDIYEHPLHGLTAVKQGFSWGAFAAPSVWAAMRGLGWGTLLLVAATTLCFDLARLAASVSGGTLLPLVLLVAALAILGIRAGSRAARWHADYLRAGGFEKTHAVVARNRRHAIAAVRRGQFDQPVLLAG